MSRRRDPYLSHGWVFDVGCPRCRWEWRELPVAASAAGVCATEKKCPRCDSWYLVVYRIRLDPEPTVALLGVIEKPGRNEEALRRALDEVPGLRRAEAETILRVARQLLRTTAA